MGGQLHIDENSSKIKSERKKLSFTVLNLHDKNVFSSLSLNFEETTEEKMEFL